MVDLVELVPGDEQFATLVVRHPATEEPLLGEDGEPWTIRLASVHSKRYTNAKHKIVNKRLSKGKKRVKSQEIDNANVELLAAITLGWDHPPKFKGELLEFSPQSAEQAYTDVGWLRGQVVDFVEDDANFFTS